jgi:hypothetical protein
MTAGPIAELVQSSIRRRARCAIPDHGFVIARHGKLVVEGGTPSSAHRHREVS